MNAQHAFPRMDLHNHTEATAPYQQGDSNFLPYYEKGKDAHLDFMGITDHFHYFWQNTKYVVNQRQHLNTHTYQQPKVFLGVEQTILDHGTIGIRNSGLVPLDYIIISVHWMSYGGRLGRKELAPILKDSRKLQKLIDTAKMYYERGMTNPKIQTLPKIIGHPFSFIMHSEEITPVICESLHWMCQKCAANHVAIELNRSDIVSLSKSTTPEAKEILKNWMNAIKENHTLVTIGSDAHRLVDIGKVDEIYEVVESYQIPVKNLVSMDFFKRT
jgi:histidinol phosphatase-like PHP family hydrolase